MLLAILKTYSYLCKEIIHKLKDLSFRLFNNESE